MFMIMFMFMFMLIKRQHLNTGNYNLFGLVIIEWNNLILADNFCTTYSGILIQLDNCVLKNKIKAFSLLI